MTLLLMPGRDPARMTGAIVLGIGGRRIGAASCATSLKSEVEQRGRVTVHLHRSVESVLAVGPEVEAK